MGASTALATPALAQGNQQFRMVTSWPRGFPGHGTAAQQIADNVKLASGGRLQIDVFGAGNLVGAFEVFDAVSDGRADLYHSSEHYFIAKNSALAFFAGVPFGMTADEINTWLSHADGQKLWDGISADFNIKPFAGGNTGTQAGGWFNREMPDVAAFKGLKIRIAGLSANVLARLGAEPQNLAGGEIFPLLQSGQLDATEWAGPWADRLFGFHRVAPYYYIAGFHEPGTTLSVGFNKQRWEGLSAEDRSLIEMAISAANAQIYQSFLANNATALDSLISDGIEIRRFSNDIWSAFGQASQAEMEQQSAGNPMFRTVYDSFRAARANVGGWMNLSEREFRRARDRVLGI